MSENRSDPGGDHEAVDAGELRLALEDTTRELQAARARLEKLSAMASLGKLVSKVAHDFRGSLGAMLTSLYLVETRVGDSDDTAKAAVERIRRAIERCDDMIGKLVEYSRDEPLELAPTGIDQWLAALVKGGRHVDGVALAFEPGLADLSIAIDRDRLARVVMQLIDNATRSIAGGGAPGRITVRTRAAGKGVEISVADNGPGIREAYRDRIFDPLFSAGGPGVGLGLAIARRVAEQHGGGIALADPADDGETCLVISLPAGPD